MRDRFLRAAVLAGMAVSLLTEFLSLFHALRRGPLAVAWVAILTGAAAWIYRRRTPWPRISFRPFETAVAVAVSGIAAVVGLTAWLSPPNSADAMAYHMPRVVYWAQAGSVAFFPTTYYNQVMLQPLSEYFMLHTYVLSGGDRFVNLVAFGAFLVSTVAVSAIAAALGLNSRGQALAALFCATLPNGILQASGAKNDWMLTLWLACAVYFAARRDGPYLGLATGLALASKATAYLFAPPMLAAILFLKPTRWRRVAGWTLAGVLLINTPQYIRNLRLSGSPLGFDSASGDGLFRWRNEPPGWKSTVSNALRNTSEQLGARSPRWNQAVFDTVVRIHRVFGLDPQNRSTTWPGSLYAPPLNANHEANANNRWHLLLLVIAGAFAVAVRSKPWMLYAAGLASAFLLFCFYLKWQPFLSRLELPLFVLAAPLAAFLLAQHWLPAVAVSLLLVNNARPALFQNWTRPLHGPHSLWITRRDDNYFSDMVQWSNRSSYVAAVERAAHSGCGLVGLDITENQLEYPFQALLRERVPQVHFVHPAPDVHPCAVLCLDCVENQQKIAAYRSIGPPVVIGRFLLFLP